MSVAALWAAVLSTVIDSTNPQEIATHIEALKIEAQERVVTVCKGWDLPSQWPLNLGSADQGHVTTIRGVVREGHNQIDLELHKKNDIARREKCLAAQKNQTLIEKVAADLPNFNVSL